MAQNTVVNNQGLGAEFDQKVMKAAVLYGKEDLRLEEVPVPELGPTDVLIKVKYTAVCGTDPHIYEGRFPAKLPLILGHEFSGEVAKVGSQVSFVKPGDRVTADINIACGTCYYCRHGQKLHCEKITQLGVHVNGAFAEYVRVTENNIHKLPESMSWIHGAYIEPLACAISGQDKANVQYGDTVVIIGGGPMGIAHALLAQLKGASKVILSELNPARIESAKNIGVEYVINAGEEDPVEAVKGLTDGRGADIVIEAVGSAYTYAQTFKLVRKGGKILVYGAAPADVTIPVSPFEIYSRELTIVSSYAGTYDTFSKAIDLIASKRFDPTPIITNHFEFADVKLGIETAEHNKDILKTVVKISE
ncbi:zinc-dependent alcohol dehydrogenase family protein [Neobacillus pocheonensis]|uniref:zinc-dependent alcohol dehydrogenase n=1 Tax=Neobacillus pocheonensis TaxID=363869 RepID=UPI003D2D9706